jgi:uncharacterized protein HI_1453
MKKLIAIITIMLSFSITTFGNITLQGVQLKDINNKPVSLDKYKGKKVYIKVWASWCPICLSGLNEINSLSADKNKNFTVITIVSPGLKGEKPTDKFIQWYKGLNYKNITVLLDEKGTVIKKARISGYPTNLILDTNLNIISTSQGHMNAGQIKGAVK